MMMMVITMMLLRVDGGEGTEEEPELGHLKCWLKIFVVVLRIMAIMMMLLMVIYHYQIYIVYYVIYYIIYYDPDVARSPTLPTRPSSTTP